MSPKGEKGAAIQVEKGASFTIAQFHIQGRVTNLGEIANQGVWYNECGGTFDDSGTYSRGWAPSEYCILSTPVIVISDTSEGAPSLVFSGRQVNAELANPNSVPVGKKIDSITVKLARVGNPAGTFEVGVFNADLKLKKSFAIANATSLPLSLQEIEFKFPTTNSPYTIEALDRIGVRYSGGDATNNEPGTRR